MIGGEGRRRRNKRESDTCRNHPARNQHHDYSSPTASPAKAGVHSAITRLSNGPRIASLRGSSGEPISLAGD
jgi:hypothetical protein